MNRTELSLEPQDGELQPVGKMPTITESESKALSVLSEAKKITVLANNEIVVSMISKLKSFFASDVEGAKKAVATITTKTEFSKEDEKRLVVYRMRKKFKDDTDADLAFQKGLLKSAADGKKKIESALSEIEDDFSKVFADKKAEIEMEVAHKKALADALTKLKTHSINPLLPAADIETAMDDFSLAFGDSDYGDSQGAAETIFESKMAGFEMILSAAVVREENARKIKEQEEQSRQRENISIAFPISELSGFSVLSPAYIKTRIDLLNEVDMGAFELVLPEADAQKQACLNMLAAFFPMALAREQEETRKAEIEAKERADREAFEADIKAKADAKQAEIDAENARLAQIECDRIAAEQAEIARQQVEIKRQQDEIEEQRKAQEAPVIAIINVDDDVAKIVDEPCFKQSIPELSKPVLNGGNGEPIQVILIDEMVQAFEIAPVEPSVTIPVKHLQSLLFAAEQAAEHCELDDDLIEAIEFAKSLI